MARMYLASRFCPVSWDERLLILKAVGRYMELSRLKSTLAGMSSASR